jgi:hypothetical protein
VPAAGQRGRVAAHRPFRPDPGAYASANAGDELLDLQLPDRNDLWLSPGGRDLAAAYLLPRAEAALRQELQRLADAAKRACQGQSSSPSGTRAL